MLENFVSMQTPPGTGQGISFDPSFLDYLIAKQKTSMQTPPGTGQGTSDELFYYKSKSSGVGSHAGSRAGSLAGSSAGSHCSFR